MLIKMYASEFASASASAPAPASAPATAPAAPTSAEMDIAVVRKPIGPDHDLVTHWVAARFGPGWASETQVALSNRPTTLWIAVRHGTLLGFACFDATARGFVGPIGVDAAAQHCCGPACTTCAPSATARRSPAACRRLGSSSGWPEPP